MSVIPGTASLLDEVDKKLMIALRDGRTLIGYLRTVDQFANLVLHRTVERIHVGKQYGDIPRGIFVIRGENVVLLGEFDEEKFSQSGLEEAPIDVILEKQRALQLQKQRDLEQKKKALRERGLAPSYMESIQEDF
ncbi:U6 snRNA-associated Sm-like protein LSm1 [Watersipora subatra]|uniref:U6 snRNA-associated Sm-like protein LSm1 n=1 Tax=Watersipora subatra TaxID=2589382 RepID=UPI00355B8EC5